ncbi:hypothetical protein LTR17_018130 [Elasticomyces elasticus]|nr:hypothetical protein LTR17_018130 [Elasticomyces elasticus]
MPRIAIAGLGCETSTFSPARTHASAFHPRRGDEILQTYKFLQHGTDLGDAATWHGSLIGHALPGGIVTKAAFEELAREIVRRLKDLVKEEPLDGLWYDIHGAMVVEELDDCEAELLRRIRQVIGPNVIVSASMDLHGNVSRELVHQTDLITCYRTAPHVDVMETKQRACHNLVAVLISKDRSEPAKHLYAAVPEVEAVDGVLDASIWVGYAWADEPRNCAAVVVTGWDEQAVKRGAERLADVFWEAHEEFDFVAPTGSLDESLEAALASQKRPYFISDSGDNPTAGGAGDVTWTLHRLLDRTEFKSASGPKVVYASIPAGSQAMQNVVGAGIGATVTVTVGAEVDNIHAGPVKLTGRVHSIKHGDRHARTEAVIQTGSISVIVTELRKPYHHEQDFKDLDLNVRKGAADIILVKIGYLEPELFDMAADWMMALTPGGVDQNIERLGHKRIQRPMWPFDKVFDKKPDLSARLVSGSNEPLL